jgi:hypothetical protein
MNTSDESTNSDNDSWSLADISRQGQWVNYRGVRCEVLFRQYGMYFVIVPGDDRARYERIFYPRQVSRSREGTLVIIPINDPELQFERPETSSDAGSPSK